MIAAALLLAVLLALAAVAVGERADRRRGAPADVASLADRWPALRGPDAPGQERPR